MKQLTRRVALLEVRRRDDGPMTIGATYHDETGAVVYVSEPQPLAGAARLVDYRASIGERGD